MKTLQREFIEVLATEKDDVELVKKCSEIANNHAIEFALWLSVNCINGDSKDGWWVYKSYWKPTNKLLEIYLTESAKQQLKQ